MANNTTFYRKANVPAAEAITALTTRFAGKAELVSFETRTAASADEARSAGVAEGETIYVATVRVADFPPVPSGDDGDAPSDSEGKSDDKSDSDKSDSDSSDDSGDDNPFGGDETQDKEDKPDTQDVLVHILQEILHTLKGVAGGGAGPDLPGGPGGPGDLDLPDVGAPPAGGPGLPPPPHGAPGKAPLPPPVKEKSPVGAGAFASVAASAEAHVLRADANELGNKALIAEVESFAPDHRVARIQRTGSAVINGETVNLPETNQAVVTLVRK